MLFVPYRFDLNFNKVPWITILVVLICTGVYTYQFNNETDYLQKTEHFCSSAISRIERMALEKALGDAGPIACVELMHELTFAPDPAATISEYAANSERFAGLSEADSQAYIAQILEDRFESFQLIVPAYQTQKLWYEPRSFNPVTMLTSTFAHGDWMHLIGNLLFFFAFAAAVELIIGSLLFAGVIVVMAFGTSISYSLAMLAVDDPLPTVGLSGVVMGMIAMLAWFLPAARIRCFYWLFVWFGRVAVPAWFLAVVYIGLDVFTLATEEELGGVNLIAHVSGAGIGLLLAVLFFREQKHEVHVEYVMQHRGRRVI